MGGLYVGIVRSPPSLLNDAKKTRIQ